VTKTSWWVIGTLAAGGAFTLFLYRSIVEDLPGRGARPRGEAAETGGSSGQRAADELHAHFTSLLDGFVREIQQGAAAAAHGRLASVTRESLALDRFTAGAGANGWIKAATAVRVRQVRLTGGTARVTGLLQGSRGEVELLAHFTRETGVWRMTALSLGGTPAL
jgi:hypothetical protein